MGAGRQCSPSRRRVHRAFAVLDQFRPDFRPQYVLALEAGAAKTWQPTWYRISVPGRPNGRTGWVRAAALELRPVQKRVDHLPRRAEVRVLGRRAARPHGEGRSWRAGGRDAARPLLRHRQVRSRDRSGLGDPRRVRIRDECVLEADRLAGRRHRRRPRHSLAESPRPGRLARLHPAAQPRRRVPAQPRPARDAGQDRPLKRENTRPCRTVPRVKDT